MKYLLIFGICLLCGSAFSQTLSKEEKALEVWLPSSIGEFKLDGMPLTLTSKAEDNPYVMCSKTYKKDANILTVVIFDYQNNPLILKKYTAGWSSAPVDDEEQKINTTTVEELPAWESYNKKEKSSQLYVKVKERYLLYLTAKGKTPDFLNTVVKELKPRQLPE